MMEIECRIAEINKTKEDVATLQNRVFQMEEEMTRRADKTTLDNAECRIADLECNTSYVMSMASYLEEKITPSSIISDLNEELKLLAEYRELGSPERIKKLIAGLKKDIENITKERDEMIAAASNLSKYINILEKSTFPIEYVKTEILDMINNYDERTSGVAMSDAGNSRFFYVLALSGLMNIFVGREKELND